LVPSLLHGGKRSPLPRLTAQFMMSRSLGQSRIAS
jgi:hypothetical protein